MTSVREALDVMGQAVSIKELAHQRGVDAPFSLREFVGAPPPGHMRQKVIPLNILQQKFDTFFKQRARPLLQVRLDGKAPGRSTLTVLFDAPLSQSGTGYDEEHPLIEKELAGPGEVLEFPGVIFGTHRYRFVDVRSNSLSLDMVSRQPVGLEFALRFETEGVEMRVEGFPDIDFVGFILKLNLELGSDGGLIDLVGFVDVVDQSVNSARVTLIPSGHGIQQERGVVHFQGKEFQATGLVGTVREILRTMLIKQFIYVDVSVDVDWVPDGIVARDIESRLTTKIYEALKDKDTRDKLKETVTRWLLGGGKLVEHFHVIGVSSDSQALTIDYIIPPGQLEPFPENPQPSLDPGRLANIDHIVVLMMENRSFDHCFGTLRGVRGYNDPRPSTCRIKTRSGCNPMQKELLIPLSGWT